MSSANRLGIVFGCAGLAMGLASASAQAAGFQLREQSAAGLGDSYAGAAAAGEDSSTIWFNPAAMTRLKGNQFSGNATLFMPVSKFTGTGMPGGTAPSDAIADAVNGSSFAFWDYSSDLKFGIGVTSPFGMRTGYRQGWVGGLYALESSLTNINVNPSVAYRISPNFSIGAGVSIAYTQAVLSQQAGWAGPAPTPFAEVKGDDIAFGFNFGALWEISPSTRLGVSYRSSIDNTLEGKLSIMTPNHLILMRRDAQAKFTTPAMASIGFVHDIDAKWTVKAGLDWTQWSSFKSLIVTDKATGAPLAVTPENWKDSWFASLGVDYRMVPGHTVRFGVAYDKTPVKDAFRTARVPDADRVWLSTGYSWDVNKDLRWDFGYAHLFAANADINETKVGVPVALVGTYKAHVDLISTGFVYKF